MWNMPPLIWSINANSFMLLQNPNKKAALRIGGGVSFQIFAAAHLKLS